VIDDLGAERFVGASYAEDWAASQLDLLVDGRYNDMRPTWYTTNLSPKEFLERYGPRLFSRLTAENPMLRVPTIPDMRRAK
jgi:DNA replication protein DnaC